MLLAVVLVVGKVVVLHLVDLVVVVTVDHLAQRPLIRQMIAYHPWHKVTLVVIFLVLLLVVLEAVDGVVQDLPPVVETEIYARQHLEIPQIRMVDLDLPTLIFILLEVVEQVNIKRMESLVDMVVVDLAATLQVHRTVLNQVIMDLPTLEAVEVVEHLTALDLVVMEDLV